MAWKKTPIDGQQSVAANKTPLNEDFDYIDTTMKIDHFWADADNNNLDGHHQFVQMPKTESGGNPADPTIATDMDGVYYVKDKTATDAPEVQPPEPFHISNDGTNDQVLQLGFRAMMHFTVDQTTFAITEDYNHNCSIARDGLGEYTLTFDTDLPSDNYVVFGGGFRKTDFNPRGIFLGVKSNDTSKSNVMTKKLVKLIVTGAGTTSLRDPWSGWVAICGG